MPRTAETPTRIRSRAGSLIDSIGSNYQPNITDRLVDTVTFKPDLCVAGGLLDPCDDEFEKEITATTNTVTVPVHGLWEGDVCSTGSDVDVIDRTTERAVNALEVSLSDKIEEALWTGGAFAAGDPAGNFLASTAADDINSGAAVGIVPGVYAMVDALNTVLGGGRGIIHVPQALVTYLTFYGLISRQGNILTVNNTDHLIVAGTGYPGTDPDGTEPAEGETWIYGTGPVSVLTSDLFVPQPAVNRSVNLIEARAERTAAAFFSPCAHIGLPVCLPDPGPECGAS